jgi:hypothetical protein
MSQGVMGIRAGQRTPSLKEFPVATPEEFVQRFGGSKVINKVRKVQILHDDQVF